MLRDESNVEQTQQNGQTRYQYNYTDANGDKQTASYGAWGNAGSGGGSR